MNKFIEEMRKNKAEVYKKIEEMIQKYPPYSKEELEEVSKEDIEAVSRIMPRCNKEPK